MRAVVPVSQMSRRAPEQGRIRFGIQKNGRPMAIDRFRFTSSDDEAIKAIAGLYGGVTAPFSNGRGISGSQVIIETMELPILLPPDPLSGTPVYELWSGGGLQRRCDGEVCEVPGTDGNDECPCLCEAQQKLLCKPTTRLNVILPEIRFGGTWRLEAKGFHAAHELPGMVSTIAELQGRGLTRGLLALERRTVVRNGKTNKFVVPVLRVPATPTEIIAGAASAAAIPGRPTAALEARNGDGAGVGGVDDRGVAHIQEGVDVPDQSGTVGAGQGVSRSGQGHDHRGSGRAEEEVVDAEIVESPSPAAMRKLFAVIREAGIDLEERAAFALRVSMGRTAHVSDLTGDQLDKLIAAFTAIGKGEAVYAGTDESGWALVRTA